MTSWESIHTSLDFKFPMLKTNVVWIWAMSAMAMILGIFLWFLLNSPLYTLYGIMNAQYPVYMSNPVIVFFTQIWNNMPPLIMFVILIWSVVQSQKQPGTESDS